MSATTEPGPRVESKRRFGTGARVAAAVVSVVLGFLFASVMKGPDPCVPVACDFRPSMALFSGGSLSIAQDFVLLVSFLIGGAFAATVASKVVRNLALMLATVVAGFLLALVIGSSAATGTWYQRDGSALSSEHFSGRFDLSVFSGSKGCWSGVMFFETAWPIGDGPHSGAIRWYLRDPNGTYPSNELRAEFQHGVPLPPDTRDSGLHRANWHLWISDSQVERRVFMVKGDLSEAWPLARDFLGCA